MTYPHIGNYGVNPEDVESARPQVAGFVVREASTTASSWRAQGELQRYLDERGRRRHQRDRHPRADPPPAHARRPSAASSRRWQRSRDELIDRARASRSMVGLDLAREVTCPSSLSGARRQRSRAAASAWWPTTSGIKQNILRMLAAAGCDVTVVPATTSAAEALALRPDGVFLSNGPGDPGAGGRTRSRPAASDHGAPRAAVRHLPWPPDPRAWPAAAQTFKLKFGHRGAQPSGEEPAHRAGRDHVAEPRLLGRSQALRPARAASSRT